ncbi:DUF937 domain-containing protein [uncultured Castellaniella sp.]|jgi:hypothetical protein|uniref:DUF937 domain-containing protein n=1 Tax=uncultured Castellaniella sp. TaxID=647907 RepID=UPI002613B5B2|nr:DUF937 domain-containing protein [uncultured Castellaniella sp.]
MQITDILAQAGGLESIARQLGITETQAASGAQALLPAVMGGFQKQAQGAGGLGGLLNGLGLSGDAGNLEPADTSRGNDVLGQIFGSKDVSRTVAQHAASGSGLDPALLKQMLPLLATLVAGFMSRQGGADQAAPAQQPMSGLLGGLLGGSGGQGGGLLGSLNSLLDANGDGNALDDILRMAGKAGSRQA